MIDQIKTRKLNADEAAKGLRLSTQAGWNQTISEWNLILNDPASICLCAELDNQVIATAAAIHYSPEFTWIAMVLTDSNFRNRGVGKQLLSNLFDSIGNQHDIKLDATSMGQRVYRLFGFMEEYKIIRFMHSSIAPDFPQNENIKMASGQDYSYLTQSDKTRFGADRSGFFKWMQIHFSRYTYLITENDEINGFIMGREGKNYVHLGPLIATSITYATKLVEYTLSLHHALPVIMDVPEYNKELISWMESKGFSRQREFIRMYKNKKENAASLPHHYLIAGPEFG